MSGWIVAAYLACMVGILLTHDRLSRGELLALAAWPVMVPVSYALLAWRRWRTRCRRCGLRWVDHAALLRHIAREHGGDPK